MKGSWKSVIPAPFLTIFSYFTVSAVNCHLNKWNILSRSTIRHTNTLRFPNPIQWFMMFRMSMFYVTIAIDIFCMAPQNTQFYLIIHLTLKFCCMLPRSFSQMWPTLIHIHIYYICAESVVLCRSFHYCCSSSHTCALCCLLSVLNVKSHSHKKDFNFISSQMALCFKGRWVCMVSSEVDELGAYFFWGSGILRI